MKTFLTVLPLDSHLGFFYLTFTSFLHQMGDEWALLLSSMFQVVHNIKFLTQIH